jgi:transketolase
MVESSSWGRFWRVRAMTVYYSAITSKHTPTVMALTRQNLPQLELSTIESALQLGRARK